MEWGRDEIGLDVGSSERWGENVVGVLDGYAGENLNIYRNKRHLGFGYSRLLSISHLGPGGSRHVGGLGLDVRLRYNPGLGAHPVCVNLA